jgi:peptide deformylase
MSGKVERKKWIKIEALSPKGTLVKKKYTGWQARIFQHEFDHLDKTLYIDRLSTDGRARVQSTLDGLIEEHGPGGAL